MKMVADSGDGSSLHIFTQRLMPTDKHIPPLS